MNCLSEDIKLTLKIIHTGFENFEDLKPEVEILSFKKPSFLNRLNSYLFQKGKLDKQYQLNNFLQRNPQDIIFLNTLLAIDHLDIKVFTEKHTILYVHEPESMLISLTKEKLEFILKKIDLILCSSRLVKEYFKTLGRKKDIEILYPAVDFKKFNLPINSKNARLKLGFDSNDFIWMMSGALLINKNPIAFLKAAKILSKEYQNTKLLWVGATDSNAYEVFLRNYIVENGLYDIVKIIPQLRQDEYYQYLNVIDGFVLTSFSESFSLAALEAASFGKPVISFPCGGVLESVPQRVRSITNNYSVVELVDLMKKKMSGENMNYIKIDANSILKNDQVLIAQDFEHLIKKYFRQDDKKI